MTVIYYNIIYIYNYRTVSQPTQHLLSDCCHRREERNPEADHHQQDEVRAAGEDVLELVQVGCAVTLAVLGALARGSRRVGPAVVHTTWLVT